MHDAALSDTWPPREMVNFSILPPCCLMYVRVFLQGGVNPHRCRLIVSFLGNGAQMLTSTSRYSTGGGYLPFAFLSRRLSFSAELPSRPEVCERLCDTSNAGSGHDLQHVCGLHTDRRMFAQPNARHKPHFTLSPSA